MTNVSALLGLYQMTSRRAVWREPFHSHSAYANGDELVLDWKTVYVLRILVYTVNSPLVSTLPHPWQCIRCFWLRNDH
jgi:hypothetical protein